MAQASRCQFIQLHEPDDRAQQAVVKAACDGVQIVHSYEKCEGYWLPTAIGRGMGIGMPLPEEGINVGDEFCGGIVESITKH